MGECWQREADAKGEAHPGGHAGAGRGRLYGGNSTPAGRTPVRGGTATYALPSGVAPDYIFPFLNSQHFSMPNVLYFTQLMYRPLYWFGTGGQPVLNRALSLADPPTFHGRNVTITLKHYRWSDGTPVTAQNVVFWLHMMLAVPNDWGEGAGFPQNVTNIRAVGPATLTMTMDRAYSPTWFLYNELSQVTPMPAAWDRTGQGPSACTMTVRDCAAVYHYLDAQAKDQHSYVGVADLVDRGRAVAAERVQPRRARHVRAEQGLLRAGQAEAGRLPGGTVRQRHSRVLHAAIAARPAGSTSGICRSWMPRSSRPTRRPGPTRWPAGGTACTRSTPGASTTT